MLMMMCNEFVNDKMYGSIATAQFYDSNAIKNRRRWQKKKRRDTKQNRNLEWFIRFKIVNNIEMCGLWEIV